jgi:hypothetical protein
MGLPAALLANAAAIGPLALLAILSDRQPDLFYRSVQEDEWLEWASFWAFAPPTGS